jgi:hypothetical protein
MKLKREMSISHADFLRLVPQALKGFDYRIDDAVVTAHRDEHRVTFKLGAERERRIASLTLPVTDVEIDLDGFEDEDAQAFIARFETVYRRGGG